MTRLDLLAPVFLWMIHLSLVFAGEAETTDRVSLKFYRADLSEVVHFFADHLKFTYTVDPEVKGVVTAGSAEPLRREDLFFILQQILRINGAAAVKSAEEYRITPLKEGGRVAPGKGDSHALWVAPVRYFPAEKMKSLLTPLLGPSGEILDQPKSNLLVVMDIPSNIERLVAIEALLDVQPLGAMRLEIYRARVQSAAELAAELAKIMQAFGPPEAQEGRFGTEFLPLPQSDRLLIVGRHSEAAWSFVQEWLHRLDTTRDGLARKIFIYPVRNGKATEWAKKLTGNKEHGPLRIMPEAATNSLIIYGTAQELQQISHMLHDDETQGFKERLLSVARQIADEKKREDSAR